MFGILKSKSKKVNGPIEFYDEYAGKVVKAEATNSVAKLRWRDYGDDQCSNMRVRLLSNGNIKNYCNCSRSKWCNKPYGQWKWRKA